MLLPHESDLVRRDPRLVGLPVVLDADTFRLKLANIMGRAVDSATIKYIRYKPGRRCLVLYEVSLGGESFEVVATALSSEGWRKHLTTADVHQDRLNLATGLTESQTSLSVFPADRRLRSLKQILQPEQSSSFLRHVFRDRPDWWDAKLVRINWRPSRRFVLRGEVDGRPAFALKGYCRSTFERALTAAEAAHAPPGVTMPGFVGCCRRHRLLAFEWLPGELLADAIIGQREVADSLADVGIALAALHRDGESENHTDQPEPDHADLLQLAEDMAILNPDVADRVKRLTQTLIDRLNTETGCSTIIHGDFYAKQVLLNEPRVAVIDFDETQKASGWRDVGNFISKLLWSQLRDGLTPEYVSLCRKRFLDGYLEGSRQKNVSALATHTAVGLLRCIPHPFRRGFNNWPQLMESLITRAEDEVSEQPVVRLAHSPQHGATEIPTLERALDVNLMHRELTAANLILPGDRLHTARIVKHKPGRRCLIAYDIMSPEQTKRITILGKIRAKGLDRQSYETQRTLWENGFSSDSPDGISVPKPLGLLPKLDMWLQEMVPGEQLTTAIFTYEADSLARRVVAAILKIQRSSLQTDRVHTVDDEFHILNERLSLVSDTHPHLSTRIAAVVAHCRKLASDAPVGESAIAHRDFFPDQILVENDRLWLLDFDLCCRAPVSLDAGNLQAHIIEQSIRQPQHQETIRQFATHIRQAWATIMDDATGMEALTLLSLARHIQICTLFPSRHPFLPDLLGAVESACGMVLPENSVCVPASEPTGHHC